MTGDSHLDPIIVTANSVTQVSGPADTGVTLKWYKLPATPIKDLVVEVKVAGGGAYQVGVWPYNDYGLKQGQESFDLFSRAVQNGDLYFALSVDGFTGGLFGTVAGYPIPADTTLHITSSALIPGEDKVYPIQVASLPYSFSVPSGYPSNNVNFKIVVGSWSEVWDEFLFASTLGSDVSADTGIAMMSYSPYNPVTSLDGTWYTSREIPVSRGGRQQMMCSTLAQLEAGNVVQVNTVGLMPAGLDILLNIRRARSIAGTVLGPSGAPAERGVSLLTRDTANPYDMYPVAGAVSDPVTGEFELTGEIWNGEYILVALDDGALRNDIVARVLVTDSIDYPYGPP